MKTLTVRHCGALLLSLAVAPSLPAAADYSTPYHFTTLAGVSSIGSADGTGANARFYSPQDVATDVAGNVYVVDEGNHTIRKVTPAGGVTTLAGLPGVAGSADGPGPAARFDSPQEIVADASDNLYVTDTGNHTIRKITSAGVVTTLAGAPGITGNSDGTGATARFNRPRGLAIDSSGNLFVTEAGNNLIRKITPAGVVTTVASGFSFPETADISALTAVSYGAIAVDAAGNLYVSHYGFKNFQTHAVPWSDNFEAYIGFVTRLAPDGTRTQLWQTTSQWFYDGRVTNGFASALAIDPGGQLVAAIGWKLMRWSPAAESLTWFAGAGVPGSMDGPASTAHFGFPLSLAYDRTGALYVGDTGNNNLRKVDSAGTVTTPAGFALELAALIVDGVGSAARFRFPQGTAVDQAGSVYVTDGHAIRKLSAAGVAAPFAGSPDEAGATDGAGQNARFRNPVGVAVDLAGNVYVADTGNHTVRKISPTGNTTTLAGTAGVVGWDDGAGPAARFWNPYGIAVDPTGNVYVTSAGTVRKIDPSGVTSTLAGFQSEVGYADATGASARFAVPYGVAVDATGNVFVTEAPDGPAIARIRKITPGGTVSTYVGAEHGYADGASSTARFHNPYGIAIDPTGNLFIADAYNQVVRKITPERIVTTVAGLADAPGSADGAAGQARFFYPQGIAVDATGNLYVTSGTTVRKGQSASAVAITTQPQSQTVAAGNTATFHVTATGNPAVTYQWQFNGAAIPAATGSSLSVGNAQAGNAGNYTVVVSNSLGSVTSNAATLTVTGGPANPPPSSGGSSNGSGGGGGAPSLWFIAALLMITGARLVRRQPLLA